MTTENNLITKQKEAALLKFIKKNPKLENRK